MVVTMRTYFTVSYLFAYFPHIIGPYQIGKMQFLYGSLKPIFHRKFRSRWLPNANALGTNNMKPIAYMANANPTLAQTIFHWLVFEFALGMIGSRWASLARVGHYWLELGGSVWSTRAFRYQHVGIGNVKVLL